MLHTDTLPKFEDIVTTYSGLTGCACGCRGSYVNPSHSTDDAKYRKISDRAARLRLNKMAKADPKDIEVDSGLRGEVIYSYEHGNGRVIRIYAKR